MQGFRRYSKDMNWFSYMAKKPMAKYSVLFFFFIVIVGAYIFTDILNTSANVEKLSVAERITMQLNCSSGNNTVFCPANYYPSNFRLTHLDQTSKPPKCPHYFHWIHEDLKPWRETGITREMVERANKTANFRLVILNGRAYIQTFEKSFQTRDVFTLWGILQLLRRYPGKIPDLDLMFDCVDWPVVMADEHTGPNATEPPPLFRYCGDNKTLDIVFPDWSFWGWKEINIKPWVPLQKDLNEGNKRIKWTEREPYAFWKGNPKVAEARMDLLKCNVSDEQDWNARLYEQDWKKESEKGFKQSDLASQCIHRYKIYIEGSAWSISEKYILACDSVTLLVKPLYYDFFTRSLIPMQHYWPIKDDDKCRSIKFAVDWGNRNQEKARDIGKAASRFIQEDLKMDYVYDYMFHLLNEYAKLLKYKPTVPEEAVELCSETMACPAEGLERKFMIESMERGPTVSSPCSLPPPLTPRAVDLFLRHKDELLNQVELLEKNYWYRQSNLR